MKIQELFEMEETIHAWFDPARGPENISGVRLAYIQPIENWHREAMAHAREEPERQQRLTKSKEEYEARGQKFFTPDLGWWMSEDDYHNGKTGFGGASKENVEKKHPNLVIHKSRREAIQAAELD